IKKEYGSNVVPTFPPKKIFTLTPAEVEQRREQLEKYMQAGKMRGNYEEETQQIPTEEVALDICLSNGQKVTVDILTSDQTEEVLDVSKTYWDMAYDGDVMDNRVGLNLLYAQFIHLGQTLKYYGYLKFDPCITDFPEKGCQVIVSAGNNELNFHVKLPNEQMKEGSFKVTRMRCWRVTSSPYIEA
ncbi:hypothetical protein GOODEAATRI_010806, partial [Goodea atripinnis]